jgi:protein-S-isoprenylcysteine O-methyltransferase Ste14
MDLIGFEALIQRLGGWFALVTLLIIFIGIWRGTQHPPGKTTGRSPAWLRSPWFYLVTSLIYFGVCILFWQPLPIHLTTLARIVALFMGTILYFPGMALTLWARLVLGRMYFVSIGTGVQLFTDHQLVTRGPFAIVRHPMYAGICVAALGGLFLYQTWTMILFALLPFGLARRARIEEQALAETFGEIWQDYRRRVPAFLPYFGWKG